MKKISEMSLEELQDYAVTLEGEKASLIEEKAKWTLSSPPPAPV